MSRMSNTCTFCDNSNLLSYCYPCVSKSFQALNNKLAKAKSTRESLYLTLEAEFIKKNKREDQVNWRVMQYKKIENLKKKLHHLQKQLSQGKTKRDLESNKLKISHELLDSAFTALKKNRTELLEKFYPNLIYTQHLGLMAITSERLHKQSVVLKQICKLFPLRRVKSEGEGKKSKSNDSYYQICNARLPKGLDPHSVPSEQLGASLGYVIQLLNVVVPILAAPALHNSGFGGSCSRIWQRKSYWDPRTLSESYEYPLFIPRQIFCSATDENSWLDRSSSNFGIASVESERKLFLDTNDSCSFNYSSTPNSISIIHKVKDLQKGISLLKKSVACITAYCYNSLCLDLPCDLSTFEAFGKLLATLSSSKEIRTVLSLKMARARSNKQVPHRTEGTSVWYMNSAISSSSLTDSVHVAPTLRSINEPNLANSLASLFSNSDAGPSKSLVEGWDIVEHPKFPPPPSQNEDVEHWTRAMFIDATTK